MATATSGPVTGPTYDVAISFLFHDLRTAQALHDELATSGLKVFFFPRRQEELAGTSGMESMRAPFLGARVNVVLFRNPWGDTPWTRIEDAAISERCFKGGWSTLMFVQLDKTSVLPGWLPPTHVRFSYDDYGLTQLIGAIKLRVQEHGGAIKRVDALGKAEAVKREADYFADRDRLMRDATWIAELRRSISDAMAELVRLASEINRLPIRPKPYFRRLEIGFHLGYRRLPSGGTWIARRFAENGRYREIRLGVADDTQDADGTSVLDYSQAQQAARDWWRAELRREEGHDSRPGPFTIADGLAEYLKAYERRGGKAVYDARCIAQAHILPALGTALVGKLTACKITDWHHGLAEKRARVRSRPGRTLMSTSTSRCYSALPAHHRRLGPISGNQNP
jgi:hypothetical protein